MSLSSSADAVDSSHCTGRQRRPPRAFKIGLDHLGHLPDNLFQSLPTNGAITFAPSSPSACIAFTTSKAIVKLSIPALWAWGMLLLVALESHSWNTPCCTVTETPTSPNPPTQDCISRTSLQYLRCLWRGCRRARGSERSHGFPGRGPPEHCDVSTLIIV